MKMHKNIAFKNRGMPWISHFPVCFEFKCMVYIQIMSLFHLHIAYQATKIQKWEVRMQIKRTAQMDGPFDCLNLNKIIQLLFLLPFPQLLQQEPALS